VEVTKLAGVSQADTEKAVAGFRGLEHRLELVRSLNGVRYYNDSFATTPDSAITALKSFRSGKVVLIAGGADKGAGFKKMVFEARKRCKVIILLEGEGTKRIKFLISNFKFLIPIFEFDDFKKAVDKAKSVAEKGDVVLLSPGCASFGMFLNYKQRGKFFKEIVKKLK